MAATKKRTKKAPTKQADMAESMHVMWLTVIFTMLSVVFALMAYRNYG
jgi:hypothetical protein